MRHRSRTDIFCDILDSSNDRSGVMKTKLMYKASLNYTQLKECLPVLTASGLLQYDAETQTFKTTEKGLRFLNAYNWIGEAMKIQSSISSSSSSSSFLFSSTK
jgi:predicted transcriptional regulator